MHFNKTHKKTQKLIIFTLLFLSFTLYTLFLNDLVHQNIENDTLNNPPMELDLKISANHEKIYIYNNNWSSSLNRSNIDFCIAEKT